MSGFKTVTKEERQAQDSLRTSTAPSFIKKTVKLKEYVPQKGENAVRIVPPKADEEHGFYLGLDLRVYYMNQTAFVQPNTFDKSIGDPMYDIFRKKKAQGASDDIVRTFRGTPRTLVFVLDLNDKDQLKYWLMPYSVSEEIAKISKNRRTGEIVPLEHPTEGRVIYFDRSGTGLGTKYQAFALDDEPMELNDSIAGSLYYFEDMINVPTIDECKQHIDNFDYSPDDDDEFDEETNEDSIEDLENDLDDEIPGYSESDSDDSSESDSDDSSESDGSSSEKKSLKERMAARRASMKK